MYLILLTFIILKFDCSISGLYYDSKPPNAVEQIENCIDESWFHLNEQTCIHLSKQKLNFEQSKNYCKLNFNANRLSITSAYKQELISTYLRNVIKNNRKQVNDDFKVWIGLNRINFNGTSILIWDHQLNSDTNTIHDDEQTEKTQISSNWKSNITKDEKISDHFIEIPKNDTNQSNKIELIDEHYKKTGLISSKNSINNNHSTDALKNREKSIDSGLSFDNRFRINRVDRHFYISNQTDKWKMSFSSTNKMYTICELSFKENGKTRESLCEFHWHPIHTTDWPDNNYKCIRFLRLSRPSTYKEIRNSCRHELDNSLNRINRKAEMNNNLNKLLRSIDILKLIDRKELSNLLKLVEFEFADHRNASWLIQLNKSTDFEHIFKHPPLFNDSCYQLLPKHVIMNHKREISKLDQNYSKEQIHATLDKENDRKNKILTHFLHEFDCDKLRAEYAICSYNRFYNETGIIIEETKKKINKSKDRSGHERSMGRTTTQAFIDSTTNTQSTAYNRFTETTKESKDRLIGHQEPNRLEDSKKDFRLENRIKLAEQKDDDRDEIIKRNYAETFDLFSKFLLVIIAINLILFTMICSCANRKSNENAVNTDTLSTHVHFDNYDHSLKFDQFDGNTVAATVLLQTDNLIV